MEQNEINLLFIYGMMILVGLFVAVLDQIDKRRRRREREHEQRKSA